MALQVATLPTLQHGAPSPGAAICDAGRTVSFARIVWGQASGLAMEVDRGERGVQPSVRPFDPNGSQGLTPGWTPEPRSSEMLETHSNETNTPNPAEPENLT